jgi:solute carrier family 6 GABA transporter-like protein 1
LNVIVGQGANWKIPPFMPFLLRYISGPVLAIIFSFAFPEFHTLRYDPMMITGFILSIITIVVVLFGCAMPRYYDAFIPIQRREEGTEMTTALETKGEVDGMPIGRLENGEGERDGKRGKGDETPPEYRADGMRA